MYGCSAVGELLPHAGGRGFYGIVCEILAVGQGAATLRTSPTLFLGANVFGCSRFYGGNFKMNVFRKRIGLANTYGGGITMTT
jgi:hypothetical protein